MRTRFKTRLRHVALVLVVGGQLLLLCMCTFIKYSFCCKIFARIFECLEEMGSIGNMHFNKWRDKFSSFIGASLSEPHIYVMSVNFVCLSVYLYLCLSVRS